jgi:hypothetical protein
LHFKLFLVIFSYFKLFQFRLFSTIIYIYIFSFFWYYTLFILNYFKLFETIVGYFWLLKVISHYVIIGNFTLYYHNLFVVLLVAIVGYSIGDCCWLFYRWLLLVILSVSIVGCSIRGYYWLFYRWLSLLTIIGYFIGDYHWLFYW